MLTTFLGPNVFSKQRELHKVFEHAQVVTISAEAGLQPWYEHIGQADLFGESAILVGYDICEQLSKEDQQRLAEHFTAHRAVQEPQAIFIVANDEKKYQSSPLQSILAQGKVVNFPMPTPAKLHLWVQMEAERLKLVLDKPAAAELISRLGGNQFAIQTELERLALLSPQPITKEVALEVPSLGVELDNFALINSWVDKRQGLVLDQLAALRRQGVADQVIIGSLAWKIESLLLLAAQGKKGKRSQNELEQAMTSLYQLDLLAKQGQAEFATGLELWLVETTE